MTKSNVLAEIEAVRERNRQTGEAVARLAGRSAKELHEELAAPDPGGEDEANPMQIAATLEAQLGEDATEGIELWIERYGSARDALNVALARLDATRAALYSLWEIVDGDVNKIIRDIDNNIENIIRDIDPADSAAGQQQQ